MPRRNIVKDLNDPQAIKILRDNLNAIEKHIEAATYSLARLEAKKEVLSDLLHKYTTKEDKA